MTDALLTCIYATDGQGPGGLPLRGTGGTDPPGRESVGTFGPVTDGPPRNDEILRDQVAGGDVVGRLQLPE